MVAQVAYFSAEFGLDANLPIYSGGLGVLAGDHVKAADDLGIPLVGVGIFYRRGYFQQRITADGSQEALYPKQSPEELPVQPMYGADGQPLLIHVPIASRTVMLRVWRADAGTVPVYLMDADHESNAEHDRRLTDSLYGGDQETRIAHEIILGIGGVRLVRALGLEPQVWHMNEGHVAFLSLERIREYAAQGYAFETALEAVKSSTIFTTHTPVPAGHDEFHCGLVERYLSGFYWQLGVGLDKLLALGRAGDRFNMTRLALHTSCKVNSVSNLHAEVSKELFHRWIPDIPAQDIAVEAVTNGVHTATWLAPELRELYDLHLDEDWAARVADPAVWEGIDPIPDIELWRAHQRAKERMIEQLGLPDLSDVLAVGFARRFATYKRANLLLHDLERLDRVVNGGERPVCLLFAGKAHPNDRPGQGLIKRIAEVSQMEAFRGRIMLIENYDMEIGKLLTQGCDVWLNTPVKPMEASGTSGMKAGLNGVLNCSVLDGWWAEGYDGANGWGISGATGGRRDEQDRIDREEICHLLEAEILPLFCHRDDQGVPALWVQKMKASLRTITPAFSTARMVGEYRDRFYLPVAERGLRFAAHDLQVAARVAAYKRFIRTTWHQVYVDRIELIPHEANAAWSRVEAQVHLGQVWHQDVRVEAVGSDGAGGIWRLPLERVTEQQSGRHLYRALYPGGEAEWSGSDANVRVVPLSPDFANDYELELTSWGTQWR